MIHKKRKKKASFGFSGHIQGRFRHISAVSGMFRPYRLPADTTRYGRISPVWRESKPIRHESSRVGANQAKSARIQEKKKKTQTRMDARATMLDAASCVGRGCGTSGAAFVLSSLERTKMRALCTRYDLCCILNIYIYIYIWCMTFDWPEFGVHITCTHIYNALKVPRIFFFW